MKAGAAEAKKFGVVGESKAGAGARWCRNVFACTAGAMDTTTKSAKIPCSEYERIRKNSGFLGFTPALLSKANPVSVGRGSVRGRAMLRRRNFAANVR